MLPFQQVKFSLGLYLFLLFLVDQTFNISIWAYLLPMAIGLFLFGKAAANIQSNFYLKAICHGETEKKQIALTFDDGPDLKITPQVLALLKKHNLLATFFLIGHKISGQEAIVQQIDAEGHLIGNHSFSHSVQFDFKWTHWVRKELQETEQLIFKCIGKKVRYFRPPFGVTNPNIGKAARLENYQVIGWNVRPYDAVTNDKALILKRIKDGLQPGSIILLHDVKPLIIEVLEELIPYLQQEGYEVIALDQLINESAYC